MRLMLAVLAGVALSGCAGPAATVHRPRHRDVASNFRGGERPVLAIWQDDGGNSIQALRPPFLKVAFWADGRVVFAEDPATWGSRLLEGQLLPLQLTQLESACLATGVFDLTRTTWLVPDSESDCMMLAISGRTILLQSSGHGSGDADFDRCWTDITRLALTNVPKLYEPATEAFAGAPASWYLESEVPTAREASPAAADTDESGLVVPSEDDRRVVEAALLRLTDDPDFDTFTGASSGPLVLGARGPRGTGGVSRDQVAADLWRRHDVPDEMYDALLLRNEKPGTTSYETRTASWASLAFDPRILVVDLSPLKSVKGAQRFTAFEDRFPAARGWVEAYLPAYTADGSQAMLRARVGPTPHGASYTAWLARAGDSWVVVWDFVAYYA